MSVPIIIIKYDFVILTYKEKYDIVFFSLVLGMLSYWYFIGIGFRGREKPCVQGNSRVEIN